MQGGYLSDGDGKDGGGGGGTDLPLPLLVTFASQFPALLRSCPPVDRTLFYPLSLPEDCPREFDELPVVVAVDGGVSLRVGREPGDRRRLVRYRPRLLGDRVALRMDEPLKTGEPSVHVGGHGHGRGKVGGDGWEGGRNKQLASSRPSLLPPT